MLVTLPLLVAKGFVLIPALLLATLFVCTIFLSRIFVGWFPNAADEMREGEHAIVQEFGTVVPPNDIEVPESGADPSPSVDTDQG